MLGNILKLFFKALFYPLVLFLRIPKSRSKLPIKILKGIAIFVFLIPTWLIVYLILLILVLIPLLYFGILTIPQGVVGKSMLPTIKDGEIVQETLFYSLPIPLLEKRLARGDIVVFDTDKTLHKTLIKRVVGLSNDTFEIKNGYVYINGELLKEPYTLKPHSTFGGKEISDCKVIKIPEGKVAVLGDNRKASEDSREIGLIYTKSIRFYLPYTWQRDFKARWRDAKNDGKNKSVSNLDAEKFVELLNKKRQENNVKPLKYEPKLSKSAKLRAESMLKFDDLSWEATKSGYTMTKAMADANYYNITYGEYPILGYYDAQELVDYVFEYPESKKFLLNKEYQDIGLSTFVGELDNCPVQIVVQHFAGYIPPNYTKDFMEGWRSSLTGLLNIKDGWAGLKNNEKFYNSHKSEVDRINEIINIRINNISAIVGKGEKNQWLTKEETDYTYKDKALFDEQESLANKLNSR